MILSAKKSLNKIKAKSICWLCTGLFLSPVLSFAQNWQALDSGLPRTVRSMYADNANLFVGMQSTNSFQNNFIKWNGTQWDTLPNPCIGATPLSIGKYQGDIVFGTSCDNVLKWDGSSWSVIGTANSAVLNIFIDNTDLYAVGWFDTIGGVAASKVARFNGSNWSAIDTTKWWSGAINCVSVFNNELYIGGNMVNYNGSISRIAKWSGTAWQALGTGITGGLEEVHCFEIFNNELFVGGYFNISNGNPGNCVAKWNGTQWSDVGGGMTGFAAVRKLKVFNGELYAGGAFMAAGGVPIYFLAKWDGTNWCGLGINYDSTSSGIFAMDTFNSELYIGGNFQTINSDTVNYIAKWIGGNFVDTCGNTTSVEENANSTIILVYPNPTHDILNIDISDVNNIYASIEIYNTLGEKVYTENFGVKKNQINLSVFSSGIYFLTINIDGKLHSKKIIKQ